MDKAWTSLKKILLTCLNLQFTAMRFLLLLFTNLILFHPCTYGQESVEALREELKHTSDTDEQVKIHNQLWAAFIDNDVDSAKHHAESIVRIGRNIGNDTMLSFGYQRLGVCFAYVNQFDSSGYYFREALRLSEQENDYESMASIQRNLGQDFHVMGDLDSASHYYTKAGENFARLNDSIGMADIYNSEAIVFYHQGFFNLAFDKALQGEKIFEQHADLGADLNQNRLVIAAIYAGMKDTTNAVAYYRQILEYFKSNDMTRQYLSNGILLSEMLIPRHTEYPELKTMIPELVILSKKLQDRSLIDHAQRAVSELAFQQGDYAEARAMQLDLVEQNQGEGHEHLLAENSLALGKTMLAMGDHPEAVLQLQKCVGLSLKIDMETLTRDAQELLAQAYEAMGDYNKSLVAYKAFKELDEKIYSEERTNRFSELQTIYETEKKTQAMALQQEEINTLYAQAKADRFIRILYGVGLLSFIAISGLLFFNFRQRMQHHKLERKQQETNHRKEIEFKKKELASQTLHLLQKHNFIEELMENLEALKQSPEQISTEIRRLGKMLDLQTAEDEKWETFKTYFSEVHNDFDQQLQAVAADISENDIRLASFLRMNLTTKEISSLLNVQPESVIKSKYRLKKKLGLDKEQDLNVFLTRLTEREAAV